MTLANYINVTWRIRQSMSRVLAGQGRTIRIPVHTVDTINKLLRLTRLLLQRLGREPSTEEAAEMTKIPLDKVQKVLNIVNEPISLEIPIGASRGRAAATRAVSSLRRLDALLFPGRRARTIIAICSRPSSYPRGGHYHSEFSNELKNGRRAHCREDRLLGNALDRA